MTAPGVRPLRSAAWLRAAEVAERLSVSPKTVSRWAKEGRLPYSATLGGHRRYREADIERLVAELSRMETDPQGGGAEW